MYLEESGELRGRCLVILQCDVRTEESTYVRLKREMGERLGVKVMVRFVVNTVQLKEEIRMVNEDKTVDGILVQLPIKGAEKEEVEKILGMIEPKKDIDGLNPISGFVPAVVLAVEKVMEKFSVDKKQEIAVVGALGQVGRRLTERLRLLGYNVGGFDIMDDLSKLKMYDVIIGSTGVGGLITKDMVKEGFVGIDLGYPKGDFSKEAWEKASKITPVPGGVGPLTIVSLYMNLVEI
jgi:methylenetetrahydrofolate dehydrogenase (NADP+)/methenyltetrahydrofolate cyclohydrolase